MSCEDKVLIIDGLNLFIRCYVVVPQIDVNGDHIGGLIGFLKSLRLLMKEHDPDLIVVVWDGEGGSIRKRKIYSEYKAGRKPHVNRTYDFESPDEAAANMRTQYAKLKRYVENLGITQIEVNNIEADDVIGYICKHLLRNVKKIIVSTDKDFMQLVDDSTSLYSPSKKKFYNVEDVIEEFGASPENFVVYRTMIGDGSDNIKGIDGIGKKRTIKLFPMLSGSAIDLTDIEKYACEHDDGKNAYHKVVESMNKLSENFELMQLHTPNISASAARQIRIELMNEGQYFLTAVKMNMMRDGIQLTDLNFFSVFNRYAAKLKGRKINK